MADPHSSTLSQTGCAQATPQAQAQKLPATTTLTLPLKLLKVGMLKRYNRSQKELELFFSQLELYYRFNTTQFLTEQEKVLFTAFYLDRLIVKGQSTFTQNVGGPVFD